MLQDCATFICSLVELIRKLVLLLLLDEHAYLLVSLLDLFQLDFASVELLLHFFLLFLGLTKLTSSRIDGRLDTKAFLGETQRTCILRAAIEVHCGLTIRIEAHHVTIDTFLSAQLLYVILDLSHSNF